MCYNKAKFKRSGGIGMKYEWLRPYVSLFYQVTSETYGEESFQEQLQSFFLDCEYYLSYLAYTKERFQALLPENLSSFNDAELEVYLYFVLTDCKINDTLKQKILDHTIPNILDAMLKIPDTSLPVTNYSFKEVLEEISNLHSVLPTKDKVSHNNIAACYSCHNVFYVDLIRHISKKHLCLCPYCFATTLYFDNDYIPMNSSFIRLAMLYYQTDIPFTDLVTTLSSKLTLRSKPFKGDFVQVEISNDEFGDTRDEIIDKKEEQYFYWKNLSLKGKTSKEESTLGNLFYRTISLADKKKIHQVAFTFNSHYFRYDTSIVVTNFLVTCLEYFHRHYFSSVTEIAIITKTTEMKKMIEEFLQELQKFAQ